MPVTLGLSSSTTVGMVSGVHGHTSHRRSDTEPSTPSSLSQHLLVVIAVARNTDCSAGISVKPSDLATLQSHVNVFFRVPGAVLLVSHDLGKRARGPAHLASFQMVQSDVVDESTRRNHSQGQAVASPCRLGRHNGRIYDASHALNQVLWEALAVALDRVACPHALGGYDIALRSGGFVPDQGDMGAAAGVVLDSFDKLLAILPAFKVNHAYTPLGTSASMPHCDPARVIPAADGLSFPGKRELEQRPAVVEMVVDWDKAVAKARGPWLGLEHA